MMLSQSEAQRSLKKGMIHHKEYITRENIGYTNNTQEGAYGSHPYYAAEARSRKPLSAKQSCWRWVLSMHFVTCLSPFPDDIGLLTFDIYPYSKIITPQPTVIDINMYDIGIQAGRMMLHKLENPRADGTELHRSSDPDSGADYHQNHINGSASYNTEQVFFFHR